MNVIVPCRLWKLNSRTSPLAPYLGLSLSWSFWKGASDSAPWVLLLAEPNLYASLAPAWLSRRWKNRVSVVGTSRRGRRERKREPPGKWSSGEWIPTFWDDFLLQVESGKIIQYQAENHWSPPVGLCDTVECSVQTSYWYTVWKIKNEKSPFLKRCCYTQDTRQDVVRY